MKLQPTRPSATKRTRERPQNVHNPSKVEFYHKQKNVKTQLRSIRADAEAKVSVSFRSRRQMKAIADALEPEISHPAGERARVRIITRGAVLKMYFKARDTASLRATMTSYLRMLGAAVNVSRSILNLEGKSDRK